MKDKPGRAGTRSAYPNQRIKKPHQMALDLRTGCTPACNCTQLSPCFPQGLALGNQINI